MAEGSESLPATPVSTFSADRAWGLTSPASSPAGAPGSTRASRLSTGSVGCPLNLKELCDLVGIAVDECLQKHGGPQQYLNTRYPTPEARMDYAKKLWKMFPPIESCFMPRTVGELPSNPVDQIQNEKTFNVHLAMLGFSPESTPKEPTRSLTARLLTDNFLTDTFITTADPLILSAGTMEKMTSLGVAQPPPWSTSPDAILPLSIGHHKSAGRTTTLHLICSIFLDDEVDMKAAHPWLYASIRNIMAVNRSFGTLREHSLEVATFNELHSLRIACCDTLPLVTGYLLGSQTDCSPSRNEL